MRTPLPLLFGLVVSCSFLSACPSPKNGVLEACEQVKRMDRCEAQLMDRLPTALDCSSLKVKFERICSQQDIDYALSALRIDADKVCGLKSRAELTNLRLSFDAEKVSPVCYQAAQSCGLDCLDIEVNEIP